MRPVYEKTLQHVYAPRTACEMGEQGEEKVGPYSYCTHVYPVNLQKKAHSERQGMGLVSMPTCTALQLRARAIILLGLPIPKLIIVKDSKPL
ncbi:MAG: hypothetical protein EAS52_11775 [Parapedobacter sp.]|nr:MAG: hypothetical protein EAS52_11775 [Parapedobacter sp.]